jgi:hypothetical protein
MAFKYKLKEEPFNVGDIKTVDGVKTTVRDIDPETGSVSWKVEYVPAFDSTFKEFQELRQYLKKLAQKTDDSTIDTLSDDVNKLFNQFRTHLRKNYPDEYKKVAPMEEISTSGAAGEYKTPFAFKGPKAGKDGVKDNIYIKKFGYKLVPKDKKGNYVQKGSGLEVKNF